MGQQEFWPVMASKAEVKILYGQATGAGGGNAPTLPANVLGNIITAISRTSAGLYVFTLRRSFPDFRNCDVNVICGTTASLQGFLTAQAVANTTTPTLTVQFSVAGVATDAGVADVITIELAVRNSGRNK